MDFDLDRVLTLLRDEVAEYAVPIVDLIAVQTSDPYKVLVATILSARTRDETTAAAASRLFAEAPDPAALAALGEERISRLIHPVGFFRNKARFLAALPEAINREFAGRIPQTVEELIRLPGVGRKTANLVVAVAFGLPAICVDTHVHRIMNIWGYVHTADPFATEMALRATLPARYWLTINAILVAFGQGCCKPVVPHCDRCVIAAYCPRIGVRPRKIPGSIKKHEGHAPMRKMLSWNVNGLRAIEKKGFVRIIRELDPDLLALQEIKALPEQLPDSVRDLPGYHGYWFSADKKGYAGVAIYSKEEPLAVIRGIDHRQHDAEGRVLTLEFADFFLVNAYFPNSQPGLVRMDYKLGFNQDLFAFVRGLAEKKSVLVCGDFNVAHREIDLANPKQNEKNPGFAPEERAWMDTFEAGGFVDTFRLFNQDPGQYTWWSYRSAARERNIGWRIDYFWVDAASRHRVVAAAILPEVLGSDHCPVSIDFT